MTATNSPDRLYRIGWRRGGLLPDRERGPDDHFSGPSTLATALDGLKPRGGSRVGLQSLTMAVVLGWSGSRRLNRAITMMITRGHAMSMIIMIMTVAGQHMHGRRDHLGGPNNIQDWPSR